VAVSCLSRSKTLRVCHVGVPQGSGGVFYTTSRTAFIESAEAYKSPLARAATALRGLPHPPISPFRGPVGPRPDRHHPHDPGRVIEATTIEDECPSIELIRKDIVEIGGIHIAAKRITGQ